MAEGITKDEMSILEKELKTYFKNNKWMTRQQVAQAIEKEGVGLSNSDTRLFPTKSQIADVLSRPMFPAEKKVGKVIVSGASNKTTTVFDPANDLLDYDKRGAEYRISEDGYDGGYKIERFAPGGMVKEVKNMPSKKWAITYAVHRMDKTQPPPPKFTPRERVTARGYTFHPVRGDIASSVSQYGDKSGGVDADELRRKPALLYGGKAEGVFADGFMLILDKQAADTINDKFIRIDVKIAGKFNQKYADEQVKEYKGKFPDYKQLIPIENLSVWQVVGFGSTGTGVGKDRTVVAYLSDGRGVAAIDADKLAVIYETIPGIDKIEGSSGRSPFRFSRNGKVVAVVMPLFVEVTNIPKERIADATSRLLGTRPRIAKHESVKGKRHQVRMYDGVPMRRVDIYRALRARGRSKDDANKDAFGLYSQFPATDAKPVDYSGYLEIFKKFRDREQKIYDKWRESLDRHTGDRPARDKITSIMERERDAMNKRRESALRELTLKAETGSAKITRRESSRDIASLQATHDARSARSRESDERQSNADTVEMDDPRVKRWLKDPGSMDVVGIDTPRKPRNKKPVRKAKRASSGSTPTSVRRIR